LHRQHLRPQRHHRVGAPVEGQRLADRRQGAGEERRPVAPTRGGRQRAPGAVALGQGPRRASGERAGGPPGGQGAAGRWRPDTVAMSSVPASLRELFETGPLVHVTTIDPDGTPHVTLAWAGVDGDEIVMANFYLPEQRKLANVRRDPRVV